MKATVPSLDELVEKWTLEGHRPLSAREPTDLSFKDLLLQLEFLSSRFYSRFVPALFPPHNAQFIDRLLKWLHNEGLTSEQQRMLFQFALRIAYFSFEDFLQLYRSAFVGPISRWIIDEKGMKFEKDVFGAGLGDELTKHTWYCPLTDSMVISEFYHANGVNGIDQRPAFRSLKRFCEPKLLADYMKSKSLSRLVLMEDFVGSGTQSYEIVEWAVANLACPVLFVPLVICPDGATALAGLAARFPRRLRVEPMIQLDQAAFVCADDTKNDILFQKVSALASAVHARVAGPDVPDKTYGAFGFAKTGAVVVLFSNTPDNTLPLVHHHRRPPADWHALFPRVSRETS